MRKLADCDECRAILRDFLNALGEVERLRDEPAPGNADTVRWVVEENGIGRWLEEESGVSRGLEDVASYRQLLASQLDNPRCPGFARAMQRMLAHYNRTGHYVSPHALLT